MILGVALAAAVLWWWPQGLLRFRPAQYDEAAAYEAIAGELRRGASLRHAVAVVFPDSHLGRLALSGQPMSWVASELVARSPRGDGLVGAGLQLAAISGASATQLFLSLADRVRSQRALDAKRRVVTAQARASALLVGLLPLAIGLLLVATRGSAVLATSAAARAAVVLGLALQAVGAALVVMIVKRAGR